MPRIAAACPLLSLLLSACGALAPAATLTPTAPPPTSSVTTTPIPPTPTVTPTVTITPSPTPTVTYTNRPTRTPTTTPRPTVTPALGKNGLFYLVQTLEKEVAVIPAPPIEGMTQRQAADGVSVEYLDPQERLVMVASADALHSDERAIDLLRDELFFLYSDIRPYPYASTYPRYRFNNPNVAASFYGLDEALTFSQVLRVKEALELFDQPRFAAMRPYIFNENVKYLVLPTLNSAAIGANYIGTNLVLLDRQWLFGNKYILAAVIAHEGSHVLQGGPEDGKMDCQQRLRAEIDDKTIPSDFLSWDAEQVMLAVKDGQIGAYHVDYWMIAKLGFDPYWVGQVIYTGTVRGWALVDCP
jgi:hypothetical protein